MQKLHILTEEVAGVMLRGFLDNLTAIPHDRIDPPHGINYVIVKFKTALRGRETEYSHAKWVQFCAYFRKTRLETYKPLERYNREINGAFLTARPNIPTFTGVIEDHSPRYVTLLEDIARNRARAPPHGAYVVPRDFTVEVATRDKQISSLDCAFYCSFSGYSVDYDYGNHENTLLLPLHYA